MPYHWNAHLRYLVGKLLTVRSRRGHPPPTGFSLLLATLYLFCLISQDLHLSSDRLWPGIRNLSMNLQNIFLGTVGTILLSTSALKLIAVQLSQGPLDQRDWILYFLTTRQLLFLVSLVELGVACSIFFSSSQRVALLLTAWLNTAFLVYRVGLWLTADFKPCDCLGGAIRWVGLSNVALGNISKILLGYMLGFSVWFLMRRMPGKDAVAISENGFGSPPSNIQSVERASL